jgi:hypothetical protein
MTHFIPRSRETTKVAGLTALDMVFVSTPMQTVHSPNRRSIDLIASYIDDVITELLVIAQILWLHRKASSANMTSFPPFTEQPPGILLAKEHLQP